MKKIISVLMAVIMTVSCFALAFNVGAADYSKPTDKWILDQRKKYKDILVEEANNIDKDGNYFITIWTDRTETNDQWFEHWVLMNFGFLVPPAQKTQIKYNVSKNALEYTYYTLVTNNLTAGSGNNARPISYSGSYTTYKMLLSLDKVNDIIIERTVEFKQRDFIDNNDADNTYCDKISFDARNYFRNCDKKVNGKLTNDMNINNKVYEAITAFDKLMSYDKYHIYNVGFCKLCPGHSTSYKRTEATCSSKGYTTYTCTKCGQYYTANEVEKKNHTYDSGKVSVKATTSKDGSIQYKCINCGKTKTKTIAKPKTIELSKTSYTYNGEARKPSVKVKDSNGNIISSKYYTVSYKNNKSVGKATVTVTFKGNYKGELKKTFKILPKSTDINSLKITPNSVTTKWSKQKTQVTGYEIQVSTSKKFTEKYTTTKKIKDASTASLTISNLKPKKDYYIRIRTFKEVDKTKYYSAWSDYIGFDTYGYSTMDIFR